MIFRNFTFQIISTAECALCGAHVDIEDNEWHSVKASELSLELEDKFNESATAQAEADGWKDNYCPCCVDSQGDYIRKKEAAEDYGDYLRDEIRDRGAE